ncbi:protein PSK SIMULATOR 1-like [Salvia miltiorrhiza]|uniref:protein PSK SIMULATOR 1-like n=1 Tax=Salvia miltiorrhiza TaxID=226208 RepID=UPI0025AD5830|nr:protein PSK SIMULATOR 1-like [Salvia miltiorrhiza]
MGALCSKPKPKSTANPYAGRSTGLEKQFHQERRQRQREMQRETSKIATAQPTVQEPVEAAKESPRLSASKESPRSSAARESPRFSASKESPRGSARFSTASDDEFYDGIPRYQKSSSYLKSRSLRSAKVSEVSSRLGRAGSAGFGRAVEVLDSLGSSVSNLNIKGGFVSGATNKSNELSILSFEVANTIVKGSSLMQSLSKRSIRQLEEIVLPEKGVQQLVTNDMDELLRIVASDKREELKVFAGEIIRFGNRCKDPQWHNLDRFFEKRSRDRTPQKQLQETAESVMMQLMTLVQLTAELYQELHTLDKIELEYQRKRLEEFRFNAIQRGDRDNSLNVLATELKNQKKLVKTLKKKSLWSRTMDEVMGKLVDIVLFLNQEINHTVWQSSEIPDKEINNNRQRLGPAGLALHYANIILQIDSIVARSNSIPQSSRDTLYQGLPPNIKDSLRSKLQSFHVEKEVFLLFFKCKDEMEKTLHWLVPVATNTAKAHHGFGWVGEWGNTGSESNNRAAGPIDIMQIETLHHADKQKTEAYILDLLAWLNYLASLSKAALKGEGAVRPSVRPAVRSPPNRADEQSAAKDTSQSQL